MKILPGSITTWGRRFWRGLERTRLRGSFLPVLIVAVFFMFWRIWQYPLTLGMFEGVAGLSAWRVWSELKDPADVLDSGSQNVHRALWGKPLIQQHGGCAGSQGVETDPFVIYPTAFFFKIFGPTGFALRLSSMLYGLGCVWLLWKIGRTFSRRIGFFAALLLAVSAWFLGYSRVCGDYSFTVFLSLLCVCLYFRLRPQDGLGWLALGFIGSLSTYGYAVGRPIILLIAGSMLFRMMLERGYRKRYGQQFILLVLGFFLGLRLQGGNLNTYFVLNVDKRFTLFWDNKPGKALDKLKYNFNDAYEYARVKPPLHYHDGAVEAVIKLDRVSWHLFLIGLIWCLLLVWRWKCLFLLVWLLLGVAPPLITHGEMRRAFLAAPVYCLIAAVGLEYTLKLLWLPCLRHPRSRRKRAWRRRLHRIAWLGGLGVAAWVGWLNFDLYFGAYSRLDKSHFLMKLRRERATVISLLKQGKVFTNHFFTREYGFPQQVIFDAVRLGSECSTGKDPEKLRKEFEESPVSPRILYLDDTIEKR